MSNKNLILAREIQPMVLIERQGPQQKGLGCPEGALGELPRQKNALQSKLGRHSDS